MQKIMTKIDDTVQKYNMLCVGDTVVAGVSGGADSMLMLEYLMSVRDKYQLKIIVANVEHGIRGQESLRDTQFVKDYCNKNNIEFRGFSFDAVNESKVNDMSVEEYSRLKRYEFFNSIKCDKIATAHNLSDNVETVLFRLARGTSIKGCCGIPVCRDKIIRPLIECTSDEIRNYCKNNNIDFVVDSTNLNNDYSRNLIRNDIVKKFNNINSNFEFNFSRFINSANEDSDYLEKLANEQLSLCLTKDNTLDLSLLIKNDISIIKRVIISYLNSFNVSVDELHLNGIIATLSKKGKYQIKNNNFVVSDGKYLRYAKFFENVNFSNCTVTKKVLSIDEYLINSKLYANMFDFYCDYDKICNNIFVRSRVNGDKISPANRHCTKSLKKLFNELKVNVENRDNIPIVCDDKGIIGIVGYCCDERVKVDKSTKNILLINILMEDSFNG